MRLGPILRRTVDLAIVIIATISIIMYLEYRQGLDRPGPGTVRRYVLEDAICYATHNIGEFSCVPRPREPIMMPMPAPIPVPGEPRA